MSIIQYTWEVMEVSEENKNMIVDYTSDNPNLPKVTMGMPLPTTTVSLESRIAQYAPLSYWEFYLLETIPVQVGSTGVISSEQTYMSEPVTLPLANETE